MKKLVCIVVTSSSWHCQLFKNFESKTWLCILSCGTLTSLIILLFHQVMKFFSVVLLFLVYSFLNILSCIELSFSHVKKSNISCCWSQSLQWYYVFCIIFDHGQGRVSKKWLIQMHTLHKLVIKWKNLCVLWWLALVDTTNYFKNFESKIWLCILFSDTFTSLIILLFHKVMKHVFVFHFSVFVPF